MKMAKQRQINMDTLHKRIWNRDGHSMILEVDLYEDGTERMLELDDNGFEDKKLFEHLKSMGVTATIYDDDPTASIIYYDTYHTKNFVVLKENIQCISPDWYKPVNFQYLTRVSKGKRSLAKFRDPLLFDPTSASVTDISFMVRLMRELYADKSLEIKNSVGIVVGSPFLIFGDIQIEGGYYITFKTPRMHVTFTRKGNKLTLDVDGNVCRKVTLGSK